MLLSNIDFKELTDVLIDRIVFGFPDDDGKNGDCILVFGSKRWMNERVNHAVKLFNEKRAPYILFSGGLGQHSEVPESELMRQMAIAMGVPSEAIIYEGESKNTTENVLCSLLALERKILLQDIKRLIIVSSPHHMQRCMLTLSRYMPKWIEYTYSCDNSSICARDNWKINEESKISVKKEAAKLLFYSKNKYIDDKEIDWL